MDSSFPTGYGDPVGRLPCSTVIFKVRILARWCMTLMERVALRVYTRSVKLFHASGLLLYRHFYGKIWRMHMQSIPGLLSPPPRRPVHDANSCSISCSPDFSDDSNVDSASDEEPDNDDEVSS